MQLTKLYENIDQQLSFMTKKQMPKVPGYDQQIATDSTDNMKLKKVLVIPSAKI